jgi:SAM-dependent methyltransferase
MSAVKTVIEDAVYLQEVRDQYEHYPYPTRNPEDDKHRLCFCPSSALDCLNYYHYSGKRDFSKNFRVLIAGGGTGDATIMMASQLRGFKSEIVHLDISKTSLEIAKERAKIRGLNNITWIHGSLLDARKILKGQFDYINCVGVLHHLDSPDAGLAVLTSLLKNDGVMELLLYAKYGREGIYHIQNLMKILNKNEHSMQNKINNCKSILKMLPPTNGFVPIQHLFNDTQTDAGLYDLLLHSNDIAYSVPDVYKFLASSNLQLTHFFFDFMASDGKGNNLYLLKSYIKDSNLATSLHDLSVEEQQAAAELLHGKMFKHLFYAAKNKPIIPTMDNLHNIPFFSMLMGKNAYLEISRDLKTISVGEEVVCRVHQMEVKFLKSPHTDYIFNYLDGHKTMKEIFDAILLSYPHNEQKPSLTTLHKEFQNIFSAFNLYDLMFLRDKSSPSIRTFTEIAQLPLLT